MYKVTLRTTLETNSLDLIKDDIEAMEFVEEPVNVDDIINKEERCIETTLRNEDIGKGIAKTFIKIEKENCELCTKERPTGRGWIDP